MSKLLLFVFTTFFSSFASAENAKLNNVIEEQKMYCKSAVLNGEFKGEKIVGFDLSKEDYFVVSEEATEELVISKNGQKALFFYPHETTCAGKSMNDFCGSSGCSYSFIIRDLGITSLFGSSCMYFPQNHVFASGAAANLLGFV